MIQYNLLYHFCIYTFVNICKNNGFSLIKSLFINLVNKKVFNITYKFIKKKFTKKIENTEPKYENKHIPYFFIKKIDSSILKFINISNCNITNNDINLLLKSKLDDDISLNVSDNNITNDGAIELSNKKFNILNITNNDIGCEAYFVLVDRFLASDIKKLIIDNNYISENDLIKLELNNFENHKNDWIII